MAEITYDQYCRRHSFDDMPAFISQHGLKTWYKDGVVHRETGPALIHPSKYIDDTWYLNGKEINGIKSSIKYLLIEN